MATDAIKQKQNSTQNGDKIANYLTSLGHACSDINQGAITALLPFLVASYGYGYTSVALLVFAANIASAIIQPIFGTIGDKHPCPWFMSLGIFFAGLGMTLIGFVQNYWLVLASAMLSGIGVAMFHPEGGRLANLAAGSRKANGMSIFAVGGNIGFFVGPILTAAFLSKFGMHGTIVFIIPASICAIILLCFAKRFKALGCARTIKEQHGGSVKENWPLFWNVMSVLSARSIISYGLLSFVPLFIMDVMGQSEAVSSSILSLFAICGAASTVISGKISERVGANRLALTCLACTAVFLVAFAFNSSFIVAIILSIFLAVATDLFYPSSVALGMSYVPAHLGTASGISYGVVIAVGGIVEPFLGMAGDAIGLRHVMLILVIFAIIGAVLTLVLQRADCKYKNRQEAAEIQ